MENESLAFEQIKKLRMVTSFCSFPREKLLAYWKTSHVHLCDLHFINKVPYLALHLHGGHIGRF